MKVGATAPTFKFVFGWLGVNAGGHGKAFLGLVFIGNYFFDHEGSQRYTKD
jgi:hypothetical protein